MNLSEPNVFDLFSKSACLVTKSNGIHRENPRPSAGRACETKQEQLITYQLITYHIPLTTEITLLIYLFSLIFCHFISVMRNF